MYVNINYFWMRNIVEDGRSTISPIRNARWLEINYDNIVAEVVNHKLPVSSSSHDISSSKRSREQMTSTEVGLFASPKKRVRTANASTNQDMPLTTKTISDLHLRERPSVGSLHVLAVVLFFSPAPLYLKVSDMKKTKSRSTTCQSLTC